MVDEAQIFKIERPHPKLWTLYIIRSLMSGPAIFIVFPLLYFRYHTLRYKFDRDGITMGWGILLRREVRVNYAKIQDIHLGSGPIMRWLGLADVQIQTASGSANAEMTIEGLLEFEAIRDYLYTRMRGYKDPKAELAEAAHASSGAEQELIGLLTDIRSELRAARTALEASKGAGDHV